MLEITVVPWQSGIINYDYLIEHSYKVQLNLQHISSIEEVSCPVFEEREVEVRGSWFSGSWRQKESVIVGRKPIYRLRMYNGDTFYTESKIL